MKKVIAYSTIVFIIIRLSISYAYSQLPGSNQVALDPAAIPKFVDPLPHFAGKRVNAKNGGKLIIKEVPAKQVVLSTGTVLKGGKVVGTDPDAGVANYWAYVISKNGGKTWTPPGWPAYTIEAKSGYPLTVEYRNELYGQKYTDLNIALDQSIMWAAPTVTGNPNVDFYSGEVPMVVHLHGGQVPSKSDGSPEGWFTPGYAKTGPTWGKNGVDQYYSYPNMQEAATLWFHDHVMGATRLNVYAGLAGMYILRGRDEEADKLPGWHKDDLVQEVALTESENSSDPKPYLPEIELIIQDRKFDTEGKIFWPVEPSNPSLNPFWGPEFFGDVMTVNGKSWPYLSVAPRKYRFRVLDCSNARFYNLWLQNAASNTKGPLITQIGTDGGLLDFPVTLDPNKGGNLFLAPAERADIIIDFSEVAPGTVFTLMNNAQAPYPTGDPVEVGSTDRIMQFVVNGLMVNAEHHDNPGTDKSKVPLHLRKIPLVKLANFKGGTNITPDKKRQLTLNEIEADGGPKLILVNNSRYNAMSGIGQFSDITELPVEGTTELWQIINTTMDAHPIHIHLAEFQIVSHQSYDVHRYVTDYMNSFTGVNGGIAGMYIGGEGPPFLYNVRNADGAVGGNQAVSSYLNGPVIPVDLNERGWKDTYKVLPGEVTTFLIRFAPTEMAINTPLEKLHFSFDPGKGPGYVWHCHILDHEDNEMMRSFGVISSPYRDKENKKGYELADNIKSPDKTLASRGYALEQNFPNPVKHQTEIQFTTPSVVHIQLTLYDQLGNIIKVLVNALAPAGKNTVKLNTDNLIPGFYFYQIKSDQFMGMKKMIVIK